MFGAILLQFGQLRRLAALERWLPLHNDHYGQVPLYSN